MISCKTRPQSDLEIVEELDAFCVNQTHCNGCLLEFYRGCTFEEYNSEQLNEAYNIIKESEDESID